MHGVFPQFERPAYMGQLWRSAKGIRARRRYNNHGHKKSKSLPRGNDHVKASPSPRDLARSQRPQGLRTPSSRYPKFQVPQGPGTPRLQKVQAPTAHCRYKPGPQGPGLRRPRTLKVTESTGSRQRRARTSPDSRRADSRHVAPAGGKE